MFSKKNKIILSIYLLTIILINIIIIPFDALKFDILLYPKIYLESYQSIYFNLLEVIIPLFITFLILEHDNDYINVLTTFKGRLNIVLHKIFSYTYLLVINYLYIVLVYLVVNKFTNYILHDENYFLKIFLLFLDHLLLIFFILLIVRKNKIKNSLILLFIMYLISFITNNEIRKIIYYLIPIYTPNINSIKLIIYKILYINLILQFNIVKYLHEEL